MKRFMFAGAMALCGLVMMPAESHGGGIRVSFGSNCGGSYYNVGFGSVRSYGYPGYAGGGYYGGRLRGGYPPVYRSSRHSHYAPPISVRHGRHYHVIPGHYEVHRGGRRGHRHW